jgi:hypothetical protein
MSLHISKTLLTISFLILKITQLQDTIIHAYILSLPRFNEGDINTSTNYDAYQLHTEVEVAIHGARRWDWGLQLK